MFFPSGISRGKLYGRLHGSYCFWLAFLKVTDANRKSLASALKAPGSDAALAQKGPALPGDPSGPGCAHPHSNPAVWGRLARA